MPETPEKFPYLQPKALILAIFLGALALVPTARASFDMSPIMATVEPTGSAATASFVVQNGSSTKVPVQISIVARDPAPDGTERYTETAEADDDWQIYPPQLVVGPGEKRTVRVTWMGNASPKKELAFRIIAEELPLNVDEPEKKLRVAEAKVQLSTKYVGSIYVAPKGVKPLLTYRAARVGDHLVLDVENTGTAHQVLKSGKLKLANLGGPRTVEMFWKDLVPLYGANILPGKTRHFVLPWPGMLSAGPIKASLELDQE